MNIVLHHAKHHHKKYLGGLFAGFAIVKTFLLLAGFFGTLTITNTFAAETIVNSGNIVSEYGCDLDASTCDLSNKGITSIDPDTFANHIYNFYRIDLRENQLTSFHLSGLSDLQQLYLGDNQLSSLDLSELTGLRHLELSNNQLTTIYLSGLAGLTSLDLGNNQLTEIDLSGLTGFTILDLDANQLSSINLSGLTGLTELYLSSNQFTTIDVSMLTGLTSLGLSNNQLTNISLSGLTGLKNLSVGYNQLSSINLSGLYSFEHLNLQNNQLSSIDLSGLSGLTSLNLSNNNLSGSLDMFCSLTGAYSIYLDHNNFDGQIPECFTTFGSLSNFTLNHNYLDITYNHSPELISILDTTSDGYFYSWKHQYLPAELSLTGTIISLSGNIFVLDLGYYNSGYLTIHSGTIYYDMIDNLSLVSSIVYTTGTLQQQYGVFGDPCFDQFYTNSTGPYLDLLNQRAQNYAGMTFFEVLRDSHDIRYIGPESEGGKYFIDLFLDGLTDKGTIDIQDMDDMFLELGIDMRSTPNCGTPAKDVYIFDLGSIPAGSGGSIIITGSISPDIDNYSFINTLYLFEPYNLRIDTATGDNTRVFPYTLSSNQNTDPETPVDPITPITTTTSNGGGITLHQDICTPNRDCSSSYYDNICGACPTTGEVHNSASTSCTTYSDELNDAYTFAFENGITSIVPCTSARLDTNITRRQLAKMITEFTIKTLKKQPNTKLPCNFEDVSKESGETRFYIKTACQLGLMGRSSDGTTTKKHFDPQDNVDRAQFGTILSRLLYGSTYNTKNATLRYTQHMKALKSSGIITNITTPFQKETRGYIMLMLMRATNK